MIGENIKDRCIFVILCFFVLQGCSNKESSIIDSHHNLLHSRYDKSEWEKYLLSSTTRAEMFELLGKPSRTCETSRIDTEAYCYDVDLDNFDLSRSRIIEVTVLLSNGVVHSWAPSGYVGKTPEEYGKTCRPRLRGGRGMLRSDTRTKNKLYKSEQSKTNQIREVKQEQPKISK